MTITPERLAAIRVLGEDEFRDFVVMDDAVVDLLSEVDSLRTVVRSLAVFLRDTQERAGWGAMPNVANLHFATLATEEIVRRWQA
jgi:hypothetical protein